MKWVNDLKSISDLPKNIQNPLELLSGVLTVLVCLYIYFTMDVHPGGFIIVSIIIFCSFLGILAGCYLIFSGFDVMSGIVHIAGIVISTLLLYGIFSFLYNIGL